MALTNCKECKKEVSNKATTCPHCGVKNPAPQSSSIAAIGLLVMIFAVVYSCSKDEPSTASNNKAPATPVETPAQKQARESAEAAKCKADIQCWFDKQIINATYPCEKAVEKRAKHTVRWTDGTFERKFSRGNWKNKEKGILNLIGDKVEFQNGFGAFTPMIYVCTYDPNTEQVLEVLVDEGRLP